MGEDCSDVLKCVIGVIKVDIGLMMILCLIIK